MFMPILVEDVFSTFLPPGIMGFIVPGAVAGGLLCFIIYKLLKEYNLIGSF